MRCPRCNAMVEDSALVCPECGLQFSETEPLIQAETEDFSAEEPEVFSDTPVDAVSEEEQPAYPEEQLPPIYKKGNDKDCLISVINTLNKILSVLTYEALH